MEHIQNLAQQIKVINVCFFKRSINKMVDRFAKMCFIFVHSIVVSNNIFLVIVLKKKENEKGETKTYDRITSGKKGTKLR